MEQEKYQSLLSQKVEMDEKREVLHSGALANRLYQILLQKKELLSLLDSYRQEQILLNEQLQKQIEQSEKAEEELQRCQIEVLENLPEKNAQREVLAAEKELIRKLEGVYQKQKEEEVKLKRQNQKLELSEKQEKAEAETAIRLSEEQKIYRKQKQERFISGEYQEQILQGCNLEKEEMQLLKEQIGKQALYQECNDRLVQWEEQKIKGEELQRLKKEQEQELQERKREKQLAIEQNEQKQKASLAAFLRTSLREGEPCPVCGSTHFDLSAISRESELERFELEAEAKQWKEELEELDHLLKEKQQEKGEVERNRAKVEAMIEQLQLQKKELETALEICKQNHTDKTNECIGWKSKINLSGSFAEEWDRIRAVIKESEELDRKISELTIAMEEQQKKSEQCANHTRELEAQKQKLQKNLEILQAEQEMYCRQKKTEFHSSEEIQRQQVKIEQEIMEVQNRYQTALETVKKYERELLETREKFQSLSSNEAVNRGKLQSLSEQLESQMSEHGISSEAWIETHYRAQEELERSEQEIRQFEEQVHIGRNRIESLSKQLGDKRVTQQEWVSAQEDLQQLSKQEKELRSNLAEIRIRLSDCTKRWKALKEILHQKDETEHQLAVIRELETVLRGKAFVSYVASFYLKRITIDANERLRDMTHGTYELALDESNDFRIYDYKNSGEARPPETLSGGETFVVSLALALALSRQVQMKGASNIELFFLDEGFGTLDEHYVNVVMDSLYELQARGLCIGLITHVEAIKERIGARLIVESAKSGGIGSKVRAEFY